MPVDVEPLRYLTSRVIWTHLSRRTALIRGFPFELVNHLFVFFFVEGTPFSGFKGKPTGTPKFILWGPIQKTRRAID